MMDDSVTAVDLYGQIQDILQKQNGINNNSIFTINQIVSSLVLKCCQLSKTDQIKIGKDFLTQVLYTLMQLMSLVLTKAIEEKGAQRDRFLGNASLLVSSISNLVKKKSNLSNTAISAKYFMQYLLNDDVQVSLLAMAFLKNMIYTNRNILTEVPESRVHSIVDELTFKVISTFSPLVARNAIGLLLLIMDLHPPLLELFLSKRYRGLKTYLNKWKGHDFDKDVIQMIEILESRSVQQQAQQILANNAIMIQSVFRGYKTRKHLANASQAIAKFQAIYRKKKQAREDAAAVIKINKSLIESHEDQRRQELRSSRVSHLKAVENIPACTVQKFYASLQDEAATKIQSVWRGLQERRKFSSQFLQLLQFRAAVKIQRYVRKWLLVQRRKKSEFLLDMMPDGLTDQRRVQLQEVIARIRERFPRQNISDEHLKATHEKTFSMLNDHMMRLRQIRRNDDHRKALLAQLSVQSEHLSMMPTLNNVTSHDIEAFASHSTPVIVAGQKRHQKMMHDLKKPWWERLDEDSLLNEQCNDLPEHIEENLQF